FSLWRPPLAPRNRRTFLSARHRDRRAGRPVFFPVRYADDFVIRASGSEREATAKRQALAEHLRRATGLELSPEKTRSTALANGFKQRNLPKPCPRILNHLATH